MRVKSLHIVRQFLNETVFNVCILNMPVKSLHIVRQFLNDTVFYVCILNMRGSLKAAYSCDRGLKVFLKEIKQLQINYI